MDTLLLKLVVTPVLIAAASLAGRRWGQAVSGWFVGLPLTSGPIAFFVALDYGVGFAAATALGALAAAIAEAAFCLAYGHAAHRARWPVALERDTIHWYSSAPSVSTTFLDAIEGSGRRRPREQSEKDTRLRGGGTPQDIKFIDSARRPLKQRHVWWRAARFRRHNALSFSNTPNGPSASHLRTGPRRRSRR